MLSIVIPVFNEEESLESLHKEIAEVAAANDLDIEVIFIDDGSRDRSWDVIRTVACHDPRVRGIRFRRNFGKAAALSAGFSEAKGEIVMTLDADLQDDPHEIPRFLAEMAKGVDVVSGWKQVRHDPWHKVLPSRVFNWMVSKLTGVVLHDHNCGMKSYRREIFDEVQIYGEFHRFVPVLAAARGFRTGELVINHRARKFGHSKYGVSRIIKGFLDLLTIKFLTGFGQRPLHMLGTIGLASFTIGILGLTYMALYWAISRLGIFGMEPVVIGGRPLLLYLWGLLLFGVQLISIGILAELIISHHDPHIRAFSIADRTKPAPPERSSLHDRNSDPAHP